MRWDEKTPHPPSRTPSRHPSGGRVWLLQIHPDEQRLQLVPRLLILQVREQVPFQRGIRFQALQLGCRRRSVHNHILSGRARIRQLPERLVLHVPERGAGRADEIVVVVNIAVLHLLEGILQHLVER